MNSIYIHSMKIQNSRNHAIISKDGKYATSFLDQAFGLLLRSNPRTLLFKTRFGIHTLCLLHAIDVLILDDAFIVKQKKGKLYPFSFYFWNPRYQYVLELPVETIRQFDIQVGDTLLFDPPL